MTINDIIALAGAGFTKDDISCIAGTLTHDTNSVQVQVQTPVPMPTPTPTPTPTLAPTPAQTPASVQYPGAQGVSGVIPQGYGAGIYQTDGNNFSQKLDNILRAVQGSNVAGMQIPAEPTVDDMLAEIINPKGVQ